MLHQIIFQKKKEWLKSNDCGVKDLVQYIRTKGELRDTQTEAIETYLFLKIKGQNKPLWQLFTEGFFSEPVDLEQLPLSTKVRNYLNGNDIAKALYSFAIQKFDKSGTLQLPEVKKAILKELQTWAKLKCFSRKSRSTARNIIDVRWVIKFKWEVPTSDASGGMSTEAGTPVRTIRARLTVRGFKDQQKADIDRYAGTSSRCSQKLIVSEAVRNGWDLCTADVPKAFLQGVTYEDLAEMTGEPLREVNFYLPADNIPLLKMIPGFEDFNPQTEVALRQARYWSR